MTGSYSTCSSPRSKIILATCTTLCIVGVAICVIAVALPQVNVVDGGKREILTEQKVKEPNGAIQHVDDNFTVKSSGVKLPQAYKLLKRSSRLARKARSVGDNTGSCGSSTESRDSISCISHPANNTIPAAHIKGHGTRPFAHATSRSSALRKGYQQRWQCCERSSGAGHNPHAFVDGGMVFNQTDKSLRVPVCGYYHIFSQIYYNIRDESVQNFASVYHLLKFESNCSSWSPSISVIGRNTVSRNRAQTTTYTSDIVHLCAGGKVWVEIPDGTNRVPCCPVGDEEGTFIAAYMVAQTSCHWPPKIDTENFNE